MNFGSTKSIPFAEKLGEISNLMHAYAQWSTYLIKLFLWNLLEIWLWVF